MQFLLFDRLVKAQTKKDNFYMKNDNASYKIYFGQRFHRRKWARLTVFLASLSEEDSIPKSRVNILTKHMGLSLCNENT
jgi:hypothetical protein